jgi:hypothetical protein
MEHRFRDPLVHRLLDVQQSAEVFAMQGQRYRLVAIPAGQVTQPFCHLKRIAADAVALGDHPLTGCRYRPLVEVSDVLNQRSAHRGMDHTEPSVSFRSIQKDATFGFVGANDPERRVVDLALRHELLVQCQPRVVNDALDFAPAGVVRRRFIHECDGPAFDQAVELPQGVVGQQGTVWPSKIRCSILSTSKFLPMPPSPWISKHGKRNSSGCIYL